MKRAVTCFLLICAVSIIFHFEVKASPPLSDTTSGQWYYHETFSDKNLSNNRVMDKNGRVIWQINTVEEQTNAITDTGALELGGARYMQRAVLDDEIWGHKQDYAMEFSLNVQKIGNEGHYGRPIAIIIPRSKDESFNEYYAVTFYIDKKNSVSNQFMFKWAIINTAAPTKMEPLVEGYYLLRENVDYTARLLIQNTDDGNVNIKFYIDGPINPAKEYKPLLEYTDNTEYKILNGVTGPALGMVGYSDDGWGISPVVRYDNIKLYDIYEFKKYEAHLKEYTLINPKDIESDRAYGEIKYLIDKGILSVDSSNEFKPGKNVSVLEFLKMLIAVNGEKYPGDDYYIKRGIELGIIKEKEFSQYNSPITKYDAALMITRFKGNLVGDTRYASLIKNYNNVPDKYKNAVLYTFYEGYFKWDNGFRLLGDDPISRADASTILLKILDSGYKKSNYDLELPHILSSGAVFQRNKKIPIWGRGVSGETITVRFNNQVKTTVVKNGHWYLELDPMPHGGPYTLTVKGIKDTIELNDILVGEVFIVAGQSNAEMYLNECNGAEETVKKFKDKPNLRFYSGEQITSVTPNFTSKGNWEPSYEWALNWSPAIGTFFAEELLELNKELADVTIGIIAMTYGGTSIEAFMPNCITEEEGYVPKDNEPIMSGFWNGFMEPIAPFAVKGVIYYQGENSTHLGYKYEPLLRDYLRGLRIEFQDSNLPVMLVQLAGYGDNYYLSDMNQWPKIRAVQLKVANTTPNTGLVTAVDLSDPDPLEIHPKEKKEIARRLANLAMGLIYGKEIQQRSAELKTCKFEGNKIIVDFNYDYGRIYFKDNVPKDFQVLDKQGKWHTANAVIDNKNNTVVIWNDEVSEPLGVQYAWVNYPSISLYNNVDLPVLPFRIIAIPQTTENIVKMSNHMLKLNDAIVNTKRSNIFRMVMVIDENTIIHEYPIKKQTAGDTIAKFSRVGNWTALEGTTSTIVKINGHGLSVGDWIRNNTRAWEARRVNKVLDENTIVVTAIKGQTAGDDIEMYKFIGNAVAE